MLNSYYHLLGHVIAATFACRESGDLLAALSKGGFGKDGVAAGEKLVHEAEALVRRKVDEVGEDRIREHAIHAATTELEMWLQTAQFKAKKAGVDESVSLLLAAPKLHSHDHTATVIARALRAISLYRCDSRIAAALGGPDAVRQVINRGNALAKKLYASTELRLAPEGRETDLAIFGELLEVHVALEKWFASVGAASRAVAEKDLRLLGRLGYVPDDCGIPVGGTSYAVVLHERGQATPPDPRNATNCPGWSAGRQGRNSENLGKGWIEPTFET